MPISTPLCTSACAAACVAICRDGTADAVDDRRSQRVAVDRFEVRVGIQHCQDALLPQENACAALDVGSGNGVAGRLCVRRRSPRCAGVCLARAARRGKPTIRAPERSRAVDLHRRRWRFRLLGRSRRRLRWKRRSPWQPSTATAERPHSSAVHTGPVSCHVGAASLRLSNDDCVASGGRGSAGVRSAAQSVSEARRGRIIMQRSKLRIARFTDAANAQW